MRTLRHRPGKRADRDGWSGKAGALMAELSDEEIANLRRTFESCDSNSDGFIDLEEFHSLLRKLDGDVSRAECLCDFEVADTEGDGYIGFKEFIVWWTG
jgi:Ca2+-binding EF-hand superfamily protein